MNCDTISKKYSKYTRDMRLKLIHLVDQQGHSTAHAARMMGIKQTSACRIMKSYHQSNRIFERKAERLSRKQIEGKSQGNEPRYVQMEQINQNNSQNIMPITLTSNTPSNAHLNGSMQQNTWRQLANRIQAPSVDDALRQIPITNLPFYPVYYTGFYPMVYNCYQ